LVKKQENVNKRNVGMGGKKKVEKKEKEEEMEKIRVRNKVDDAMGISLFGRQHQSECLSPSGISLFCQ
jgi:hypothetical protein